MVKKPVKRMQGKKVERSVVKNITGEEPIKAKGNKKLRLVAERNLKKYLKLGWVTVGKKDDSDLILMEK